MRRFAMSHTTRMLLEDGAAAQLREVMSKSAIDSVEYKRSGISLGLGEGKQCKELAVQFSVDPDTVTTYRHKFEAGGVTGLLSDAPRPGRCGLKGTPVIEKVKQTLSLPAPEGSSTWDANNLASELHISLSAARQALTTINPSPLNNDLILPQTLRQGKNEIRGLYLNNSVQILAIATSLSSDSAVPIQGEQLMVYDSSDVEYRETALDREGDRLLCLACQSLDSFPDREPGVVQSPNDFVQTVLNTPNIDGSNVYFLVNIKDDSILIPSLPLESSFISHCLSLKKIKSIWYSILHKASSYANQFLKKVRNFITDKSNKENDSTFIWRSSRVNTSDTFGIYIENEYKIANSYSSTGNTDNDSGKKMICTAYYYDSLPTPTTFSKCENVNEYVSLVGTLEQKLHKKSFLSLQALINFTLNTVDDNSSCSSNQKKTQSMTNE